MPANVLFVKSVLDTIVNFSPIPKDLLYEKIGEPIFGSISGDEDEEVTDDLTNDISAELDQADLDDEDYLEESDVTSQKEGE